MLDNLLHYVFVLPNISMFGFRLQLVYHGLFYMSKLLLPRIPYLNADEQNNKMNEHEAGIFSSNNCEQLTVGHTLDNMI